MNKAAVFHRSTRAFVCPSSSTTLELRLLCARSEAVTCEIYYWHRVMWYPDSMEHSSLHITYRDAEHDDWRVTLHLKDGLHSLQYYFVLSDAEGNAVFCSDYGVSEQAPRSGFFEYLFSTSEDVLTVPQWAKGAVWYQIFPERFNIGNRQKTAHDYVPWDSKPELDNWFGGDLKGITGKLDYLRDLGVEVLYLNPIFKGNFNHKYAVTDYYQVDPDFGTLADLQELVSQAHQRGIRVVLDGVFNHVGCEFKQFADLCAKGEESVYKHWFIYSSLPICKDPLNYRCFEVYAHMPKLRTSDPDVRQFILNVMSWWIENAGIDGWRLDVADEVESGTWQYMRAGLKNRYPQIILMAETWCDAFPMLGDGCGVDCAMNYLFRFAVRDWIAQRQINAAELDNRINRMLSKYNDDVNAIMYNLLDSHDTERFLHECGEDKRRLRLAWGFAVTFPGAPAVYYGDEVGMTGSFDPDCRRGMIWDETLQDRSLLDWYRQTIRLRRTHAALRLGSYRTIVCDAAHNTYGFLRRYEGETVYIVFNNSSRARTVELPVCEDTGSYRNLLDGTTCEAGKSRRHFYNEDIESFNACLRVQLPAYGMAVFAR